MNNLFWLTVGLYNAYNATSWDLSFLAIAETQLSIEEKLLGLGLKKIHFTMLIDLDS